MTSQETTAAAPANMVQTLAQRRGVRQFVKFCIVGLSSTLVDFGIYLTLIEVLHIQSYIGLWNGRIAAQSISFLFAVTNGFIWNSRWTFRHTDAAGLHQRYVKFVLTNLIGLALNLTILSIVSHIVPVAVTSLLAQRLRDPAGFIGKLAATCVVVFWNFTASKYWTFKK